MPTIISDLPGSWSRDIPRISLYLMSCCHHCQWNWEARCPTANLVHCFIIASFQEQLGSKLAVHWHHGQAHLGFSGHKRKAWVQLCLHCRDDLRMLYVPINAIPHLEYLWQLSKNGEGLEPAFFNTCHNVTISIKCLCYCPEQAPMGARSSSAKNWGWAVTRRRCLNGSTIPVQGPTPDAK